MNQKRTIPLIFLTSIIFFLTPVVPGIGQSPPKPGNIDKQAVKHVEDAVRIQQRTQKKRTQWVREKTDLVLQYEQLIQEKQILEKEKESLLALHSSQESLNQSFVRQKKESIRIQQELIPFLNTTYTRLETLIQNDPPFLKKERTRRLAALSKIIIDQGITIAERYRKILEALFIEAEYGSTVEVYQDKIILEPSNGEETLCNIFRLGRVSLFFLSLDQAVCGVFDPGLNRWQVLPDNMLPPIRSAVEIAGKRRPVELLPLPIGRLADKGGDL